MLKLRYNIREYALHLPGLLKMSRYYKHTNKKTDGYSIVTVGDVATVKLIYQDDKELVE